MNRFLLIILIFFCIVRAGEHYARVEPIETFMIKSEVNGRVIMAKNNLEGRVVNGIIVKIDDKLDRVDLNNTVESLKLIKQMIKLNEEILPHLKKSLEKKKQLYLKTVPLNSSSVSQKDTLYSAFVSAKSQYSATLEKILNLKNQEISLEQKIAQLKDRIEKKSIKINNKYLYNLNVKKGEFVNIGSPIATVQDLSKAKLTLFLNDDELKGIKHKKIYINGRETDLKFSKIWRVADSKNISLYKAEIILNPKSLFSKLVKVEIK